MARSKKVSKESVRYRSVVGMISANRKCGTCIMYRPNSDSCTLVAGRIGASDVCNRWEHKPNG